MAQLKQILRKVFLTSVNDERKLSKITLVVGSAGHFYQLLRVHVVDNLLRYIITITGSDTKKRLLSMEEIRHIDMR